MKELKKVVLLYSGGMDSTALLYELILDYEVYCLGFDYGQRHLRELNAAYEIIVGLQKFNKFVHYFQMEVPGLTGSLVGNFRDPLAEPLVGPTTVVPGRNLLFLSLGASLALKVGAKAVAIAAHAGDAAVYPDCRAEFLFAANQAFEHGYGIHVMRPYIALTKDQIVLRGRELRVPWDKTWSCYAGRTTPCGECGACIERKKALGDCMNQGLTFAKKRPSRREPKAVAYR